jgi:hypothetical protein
MSKTQSLVDALEDLGRTKARYGYQGPSGAEAHPSNPDLSIAENAKIHEYGLGVPARPLIRTTAETHRKAFRDAARTAAQKVARGAVRDERGRFAGRDVIEAVRPVAEGGLSALRDTLRRSRAWAEPNAERTRLGKGHDQPLIGEEQTLHTHASWAVVQDGEIVAQGGEE